MNSRLGEDPRIAVVERACVQAGAAIVEHYQSELAHEHEHKSDQTPLTEADLEAHRLIIDELAPLGLPVLSEESDEKAVAERHDWGRFWLVDPLDGTREFLERTDEFTVNIALIEQGEATLGMIYAPMQQALYLGIPGRGAWKKTIGEWLPIRSRQLPDNAVVLTSRRQGGPRLNACLDTMAEYIPIERSYAGSALKLCWLAEGRGDVYPRFGPCSEWDTAAGQALLEAAGGKLVDLKGRAFRYNQRNTLLNSHFIAVADREAQVWDDLIATEL